MKKLLPLWITLLTIFSVLMIRATWLSVEAYGIWGVLPHAWETARQDPIIAYAMIDMCGGFGLVFGWILLDCRKSGRNFRKWFPFLILFGTVGVMAYLIQRERRPAA